MGQVVLVIGEAGLGKSRLVQTLAQCVEAHGSDVALAAAGESASASVDQDSALIEWRCSEQFQNSELYPVADYLERFLGTGRDPSPTARFDRLARHLDACDLGRPEVVALFAKLLLLPPDERYSVAGLTPAREREETFCALREWLLAYSRKRSVLFVVEDLHWIDASSLEFLKQFISEGPHDRILTVLTFRPEFKTPWPALAHQTNLALNRLTRRQVAEWIRRDAWRNVAGGVGRANYQPHQRACHSWSKNSAAWHVSRRCSNPPGSVFPGHGGERERTAGNAAGARDGQARSNVGDHNVAQLAATLGHEFDYALLAAVRDG